MYPLKSGFLILICLIQAPAICQVNLEVVCSGEEAVVSLGILNTFGEDIVGIAVTRETIGVCETPVLVTNEPIALPPIVEPDCLNTFFTAIAVPLPLANVHFTFIAHLVDEEGNLLGIPVGGPCYPPLIPYDTCAYGEAVIMRGQLSLRFSGPKDLYWDILIEPCSDGCWGDPESFSIAEHVSMDDPMFDLAYNEEIVDVVGTLSEFDGMPQNGPYHITRVELAPNGTCGALPERKTSWGSFKAAFR